jgi:hypothetical protein
MPTIKEALLGTEEQNRIAQENLDKQAREGSKLAKFLGGNPEPKETVVKETPQPVEKKAKGGKISSASKRADGCAMRGKTKGKML